MATYKQLFTAFAVAVMIGIQLAAVGCSSGNGWKVEFGVVPINQVSDTKQLSKGAK